MQCPECDGEVLVVAVPDELRGYLPDDPDTAAVCRRCLTTTPHDGPATDDPEAVADLSDALPSNPEAALSVAVFVTLCGSLALNRSEIETLVSRIERAGVDPLSALDRLESDPDVELAIDVERRRTQLVQLLG
jgi:hypothetical protein